MFTEYSMTNPREMAGERVTINTGTFTNDMTTFAGRDDVMTLLVGINYDKDKRHTCIIEKAEM